MTELKRMPLACPTCGCEAGRYDFGKINVDGKRTDGRSQWPCGFNYELRMVVVEDLEGNERESQEAIVHRECTRILR